MEVINNALMERLSKCKLRSDNKAKLPAAARYVTSREWQMSSLVRASESRGIGEGRPRGRQQERLDLLLRVLCLAF